LSTEGPSKLAFLIWSATPDRPDLCVTPLVHALAARALDYEVEIHFAGPAVRWLVEGVAAGAFPTPEGEKSIQRFLDELAGEGVKLYACGMANASWIAPQEALIAQCSGSAGATAFVARCLDPDWRTQVY
jgi:predicted peroxiredoxin